MYEERSRCYELLGLAPGASAEELKAAHRDLVKVWHPDRFAHDPRLREKAQEKLKEINEAYEFLTSGRQSKRANAPAPESRPEPSPRGRRARWPYVLLAASVFGMVFVVFTRTLWTRGGGTPVSATMRTSATEDAARPPRDDAPAANQQPQSRKRTERDSSDTPARTGDATPRSDAAPVRALPTVTVLIDPTTGLLATASCPVRSRRTFAEGHEPSRQCDAHRKESPNRAP